MVDGPPEYDGEPPDGGGENRLDNRLRVEFSRAFPTGRDSTEVLGSLGPAFRRARRVHRTRQVLAGVGIAVVLAGAVGLGAGRLGDRFDSSLTVAGEPESVERRPQEARALEVTGTTAGEGGADPSQTTERPAGDTEATVSTSQTTAPAPSTTSSSTSVSTATSTSTTVVGSVCGSLVVSLDGAAISLAEPPRPQGGYSVDVKADGPTEIEVGFEGGRHCELKVKLRDGRIEVERDD